MPHPNFIPFPGPGTFWESLQNNIQQTVEFLNKLQQFYIFLSHEFQHYILTEKKNNNLLSG